MRGAVIPKEADMIDTMSSRPNPASNDITPNHCRPLDLPDTRKTD